jgi:hypothetical protein
LIYFDYKKYLFFSKYKQIEVKNAFEDEKREQIKEI